MRFWCQRKEVFRLSKRKEIFYKNSVCYKVLSLFSGIGAFEKALSRLNIPFEIVGFSEIDKYAIEAYCVIHNVNPDKNLGDISKIDEKNLPDFDLLTYGFPCQDVSIAGKQRGLIDENGNTTRSGLLFDALRIIKHKKPKYAIAENVKGLVTKKFKKDFDWLLEELESYGYNNYWKVLNAKDYGIPQNRERVFIISIRKDIDDGKFRFPEPFDNGLRLKDFLEHEVNEKYYVSQEKAKQLINELKNKEISNTVRTGGRGSLDRHTWDLVCLPCLTPERLNKRQSGRRFKENEEPMFTLTAQDKHGVLINRGNIVVKNNDICSCIDANYGKGLDNHGERTGIIQVGYINNTNYQAHRVYDINGVATTQKAEAGGLGAKTGLYAINYRIRRLTPLECWRLMGFDDDDYWKAKKALELKFYRGKDKTDSQMYKLAGNSIVVNVLEAIFSNLFWVSNSSNKKAIGG